jgi:hypothetical protein
LWDTFAGPIWTHPIIIFWTAEARMAALLLEIVAAPSYFQASNGMPLRVSSDPGLPCKGPPTGT